MAERRKPAELYGDEEFTDVTSVSGVFRSRFPEAEERDFQRRAWAKAASRPSRELRPLHPTMLHALASAAKAPEDVGVTLVPEDESAPEEHRSYRSLYAESMRLAAVLAEAGVARGDRVLLVLPTSFEFAVSFFAAQMAGAVPVPSYPPALLEKVESALERLAHVARASGAAWCLANRQLAPLLGELALQAPALRSLWTVESLLGRAPAAPLRVAPHREDSAFIQYTSGSTGNPKGVLLAHRNLVSNIHAAGLAAEITHADRMVSWLPMYHDMGLVAGLLWPVYWKLPLVLLSPTTFLTRPVRWLEALTRHRATISCAPNFGYALCVRRVRPSERGGLELSSWRIALSGAEPVNLGTLRDFAREFAPHGFRETAFYPCYGLAESTVAVTFPRPGEPVRSETVDRRALAAGTVQSAQGEGAVTLVCCGRAVPGHDVLVVDEKGAPLAERRVGHVVVRGPSVMRGYFGNDEATAKVLRDGWLWTGDLGYLAPEGLYVAGRAKDLLIVRGKNFYAEDIEAVAETVAGVRPGGTAAFGLYDESKASDVAAIVCETKEKDEKARAALAEAVAAEVSSRCGLRLDEVVLVPPGTVPKTSSGKRQRALCRERYLAGKLRPSRTGRLDLALVFVRSAAGFLALMGKGLPGVRREPD